MRSSLLFSFGISLISILIVLFSPFDVPISVEGSKAYSPYNDEINRLLEKGEQRIEPSESARLSELVEKNNQWFAERRKNHKKNFVSNASEAWKKKSSILAPGIMVLWGVLFYLFCRNKPSNNAFLVLVFPVILTIAQLMSFLELVLIAFAVLAVWFWFLLNPLNSSPPESGR